MKRETSKKPENGADPQEKLRMPSAGAGTGKLRKP